jgi:hypothetical protein
MATVADKELRKQQRQLEYLRARVNAAKIAYLNRTPFEDMAEVSFDALKLIAQEFIRASYKYQKLKYGSVRVRLSVGKLLRH